MAHITIANDPDNVLASLANGEPITMRDNVLVPINSQKRKNLLANIDHILAQWGRSMKQLRDIRAEVSSLTVEE